MKTRFFPNITFKLSKTTHPHSKLTLVGPSYLTKHSLKRFLEKNHKFNVSKINTLNVTKLNKTKKFNITLK